MKKLTVHEQVAKRDAEENPKTKKCGFKKKEKRYIFGKEVSEEAWKHHLSVFGTPSYSGPVIGNDGKTVMVKEGKEISGVSEGTEA